MTFYLTPAELALTRAKLDKINARAAKKGLSGALTLDVVKVERTTQENGFTITEIGYNATITGDAVKYNGWEFVARIDVLESGTALISYAPSAPRLPEAQEKDVTVSVESATCDHCATTRRRNAYYVVTDSQGVKVVGSTCIKDFLGWEGSFAFITETDIEKELRDSLAPGSSTYSVETVLGLAWASTMVFGFIRSGETGATADTVRSALGRDKTATETRAMLQHAEGEATKKAAQVRAWILSDAFSSTSDYASKLKTLAAEESVAPRHIGMLASAPAAWMRAQEKEVEQASAPTSQALGTIKEKLEFTGTIKSIRYIESMYGVTTLYTLVTPDGNVVKWFSSTRALGTDEGVVFTLRGTVKAHEEWKGQTQTVVTRCKILS